jgi:hypothetical protein
MDTDRTKKSAAGQRPTANAVNAQLPALTDCIGGWIQVSFRPVETLRIETFLE